MMAAEAQRVKLGRLNPNGRADLLCEPLTGGPDALLIICCFPGGQPLAPNNLSGHAVCLVRFQVPQLSESQHPPPSPKAVDVIDLLVMLRIASCRTRTSYSRSRYAPEVSLPLAPDECGCFR